MAIPSQSQLNTFAMSPFLTQPLMRVVKATMSGLAPALERWSKTIQNHQTSLLEMGNELEVCFHKWTSKSSISMGFSLININLGVPPHLWKPQLESIGFFDLHMENMESEATVLVILAKIKIGYVCVCVMMCDGWFQSLAIMHFLGVLQSLSIGTTLGFELLC